MESLKCSLNVIIIRINECKLHDETNMSKAHLHIKTAIISRALSKGHILKKESPNTRDMRPIFSIISQKHTYGESCLHLISIPMAQHSIAWYGIAWYGMVWYGMVWYDINIHVRRGHIVWLVLSNVLIMFLVSMLTATMNTIELGFTCTNLIRYLMYIFKTKRLFPHHNFFQLKMNSK